MYNAQYRACKSQMCIVLYVCQLFQGFIAFFDINFVYCAYLVKPNICFSITCLFFFTK